MATTPCPRCQAAVPVEDEEGACLECGLAVRFEEVPEAPCTVCGADVVLRPDREWVPCPDCGAPQATDPRRDVVVRVRCPRCRRPQEVTWDAEKGACAHCGARYGMSDTL